MAETNFKSRSFLLKEKRRQILFPLLSARAGMQARAMEELLAILQKPHPDGNYVGLRNQYLNKTCDCPVLTPYPAGQGAARFGVPSQGSCEFLSQKENAVGEEYLYRRPV